ncbi:MAG: hypothetical protein ABJN35_12920 [Erythrobacter sp.]
MINGALVTATQDCILEVGSGAFVLSGRALWRDRGPKRNPREELYFSMIDAATSEDRFNEERFRLFALLSQVVAQERTHEAQKECALCASALIAGNSQEAVRSASRLAAERLDRPATLPGRRGEVHERRGSILPTPSRSIGAVAD